MQKYVLTILVALSPISIAAATGAILPTGHPDSSQWESLFADDLSDAIYPEGIWMRKNGELTATKDLCIFSKKSYENFVVDLEFKLSPRSNSGLLIYATDVSNWIPHSIEIQISDTHGKQPNNGTCGSVYGHVAPSRELTRVPGEWNRMTVTCKGPMLYVVLNGQLASQADMRQFKSNKTNPDGSAIPGHLTTPLAELATHGHIGLQGEHHGRGQTFFRNVKIKLLD